MLSPLVELAELNDEDLVKAVEDLEKEITYLEMENRVFEKFLLQTDPVLIAGKNKLFLLHYIKKNPIRQNYIS